MRTDRADRLRVEQREYTPEEDCVRHDEDKDTVAHGTSSDDALFA
jgi:hypothetical protein